MVSWWWLALVVMVVAVMFMIGRWLNGQMLKFLISEHGNEMEMIRGRSIAIGQLGDGGYVVIAIVHRDFASGGSLAVVEGGSLAAVEDGLRSFNRHTFLVSFDEGDLPPVGRTFEMENGHSAWLVPIEPIESTRLAPVPSNPDC